MSDEQPQRPIDDNRDAWKEYWARSSRTNGSSGGGIGALNRRLTLNGSDRDKE